MADRLWRAQVSIPLDSLVPEDAIVNTLYFDDDDDPAAAPSDTRTWIMQMLTGFYQAVDALIFPSTIGPAATVRLYDMRDAEPRQVLYTESITLTPGIGDPLPGEVALCLSFAAAQASGVNPARRRGRIYLGPITAGAGVVIGSQNRPGLTQRTSVANAAATMRDGVAHPGAPGFRCRWAIYSPTTDATGTLEDSFNDVLTGWVDDSWDTQRRRGAAPTARATF